MDAKSPILFQAFGWWGAGKKLKKQRKIVSFCAGRVRFNLLPTIQTPETGYKSPAFWPNIQLSNRASKISS